MSIKKLFDSTEKSRNYLTEKDSKSAFEEVESAKNLEQLRIKQEHFQPQIDYNNPEQFARFGSAILYYKSVFTRILDYYPYDGSDAEINKFTNENLDIENYILDNLYPRTNGYARLGYSSSTPTNVLDGYGVYTALDKEYIKLYGGPGTGSVTSTALKDLSINTYNDQINNANVYDTNLYKNDGLPTDYGKGTRQSNLRSNFDDGVTIEFWLDQDSNISDDPYGTWGQKKVVFDMWNGAPSASADYGRITLGIEAVDTSDASDRFFTLTCQSGTTAWVDTIANYSASGFFETTISDTFTTTEFQQWKHYALTLKTSGSFLVSKFYVTGGIQKEVSASFSYRGGAGASLGEINPKPVNQVTGSTWNAGLRAHIGSLIYAPSGSETTPSLLVGAGRLSGSLDEFRFWKVARNAREIGTNYFTQIRGGVNTDISNTTLGVYYKFNEGITGTSSVDKSVLDYAGRVTNGVWTGYTAGARNIGSAIISASAADKEYKDPIIRPNHPDVISLKSSLVAKGEYHDLNNNSSMLSLLPGWIIDDEEVGQDSDLQNMCHIMGAYFDKLYLQISQISRLKNLTYTSASHKPFPFAEHLPQSLGLYSPELFVDASVMEKFTNRDDTTLFEGDLHDTKNLIYSNLYNNLTAIYKSKGTEKAIRNVFRCFNIDEKLLRLTINSNREEYTLRNNVQQTLIHKNCANFNTASNTNAVIYQYSSSVAAYGPSQGYITGSKNLLKYGFTAEANIVFPHFDMVNDTTGRDFISCSLFGAATVLAGVANTRNLTGIDTRFANNFAGISNADVANFQVSAVRTKPYSKDVYFVLESKYAGAGGDKPFPELTSSTFLNVYDNEEWNISVRLKPSVNTSTGFVEGTGSYAYEVEFYGVNTINDAIANTFKVSSSISQAVGQKMLFSGKRMYVGALRTDLTGTLVNKSDVLVPSVKYWTKYLEDSTLKVHALDVENIGISGSMFPLSPLDTASPNAEILNSDTLALNWNFLNVTGADGTGNFLVQDFSSGSYKATGAWGPGWLGPITKKLHAGYGYGFQASSANAIDKRSMNSYRFINPEHVVSSDMITIFDDEDRMYPPTEFIPNYVYTIEKSLYNAISEEMLDFFAGVVDFNTIIGAPVNRYRDRYKSMEALRRTFFRRVNKVKQVEKYLNYYKWFDDAISSIIGQIVPASAEFVDDILNVVEPHVLERPKYQSRFPTLNFYDPDVQGAMHGLGPLIYSARLGRSTIPSSPRSTRKHELFWKERALRNAPEITSGDSTIDTQRETLRKTIIGNPRLAQPPIVVSSSTGGQYNARQYGLRAFNKLYKIEAYSSEGQTVSSSTFQGGVNFSPQKNLEFARVAVWPAGPINTEGGVFIPENVLFASPDDYVKTPDFINVEEPANLIKKIHRVYKVQHGRDWQLGQGYKNLKSTVAFPFNIMSSSARGGYIEQIRTEVSANLDITNLHNDVYGPMMEKPLQGPFTDYAVGGLQSRHIAVNFKGTDTWHTRPEQFNILLGSCIGPPGAIGVVGPDYPWPEANNEGVAPYPLTGSKKAYLYRDFIAKRPVNIRNILMSTGSTILGNYTQEYEVLHSFGTYANPRHFIDNQPPLPTGAYSGNTRYATQIRTYLDVRRNDNGHRQLLPDYSVAYLTGTQNKQIITTRFSNPGSITTMGVGYRDIRGNEYSVYNAINYRNIELIKPSQGPSGTISQPTGAGTTGIRVYDLHGKDFGLRSHIARHSGRFGRDSLLVTDPGASYTQLPAQYKIQRNTKKRIEICGERFVTPDLNTGIVNRYGLQFGTGSYTSLASRGKLYHSSSWTKGGSPVTTNTWTISTWIRLRKPNTGTTMTIMSLGDNGASLNRDQALAFYIDNDEKLLFWIQGTDASKGKWKATSVLDWNTWYHVAVTYDGSDVSNEPIFYITGTVDANASAQAPTAVMESVNSVGAGKAFIGGSNKDYATSHYQIKNVDMDEMAIYDKVLTAAQIQTIYSAGGIINLTASFAPETGSLVTWIRFGDVTADPTTDPVVGTVAGGYGATFHDQMGNNEYIVKGNGTTDPYLYFASASNVNAVPPVVAFVSGTSYAIPTYCSSSRYDNYSIRHQIPQSDRQYRWISASIVDPDNINYSGYQKTYGGDRQFRKLTATTYEPFFAFVSASDEKGTAALAGGFQPVGRLNTLTLDAVSGAENTIGFPDTAIAAEVYLNAAFNDTTNIPSASYLNLLLSRREATYGWTWRMWRAGFNSPILIEEMKNNQLSAVSSGSNNLYNFSLPPISMKGRTSRINYDAGYSNPIQLAAGKRNNITLRSSHTNEKIYFNELLLNNLASPNPDSVYTPLDSAIAMTKKAGFRPNWIVYSQNVFPSMRNEFTSRSVGRIGYDNGFWRNLNADRVILGADTPNSFKVNVSQSAWCLDAPVDFLTRSNPPSVTGQYDSTVADRGMRAGGKSGELQNTYFQYITGSWPLINDDPGGSFRYMQVVPSGLYARKHMLGSPRSVVAPSGMDIPETGTIPSLSIPAGGGEKFGAAEFVSNKAAQAYSGESLWEAPSQAGIIIKSGSTSKFIVSASNPWFNDYDSFHADLKLAARGYSTVPEFRISDHADDYIRYGELNIGITDTFSIPGTGINSSTASFYKDYSNSDFLQGFLKIKNRSMLDMAQIKLTVEAAIRFNPYRGFYPAQRTLDLVSQFSRSYGPGLSSVNTASFGIGIEGLVGSYSNYLLKGGQFRPIIQPFFAPGILYNSIKSGLAVDYPIVTDPTKFERYAYGGTHFSTIPAGPSAGYSPDNWALGYSGITGSVAFEKGIYSGSFWDKRIPFEAIIEPDIHIRGTTFLDMEPHPSCSLPATASWMGNADDVYVKMASNFFGEVGNFFLKDRDFTNLESNVVPNDLRFQEGDAFAARVTLRRSMDGARVYSIDTGSMGFRPAQQTTDKPFNTYGYRAFVADDPSTNFAFGSYIDLSVPLPQDPKRNPTYRENFTMYSRPTAFGPPVVGRRYWANPAPAYNSVSSASMGSSGSMDCFDGYNWSFTPPYYHGEAWADLIFRPDPSASYDLERIMSEINVVYWRADSGPPSGSTNTAYCTPLIPGGAGAFQGRYPGWLPAGPYCGDTINGNAMQLSSSFNLFGVERVFETTGERNGVKTNKTVGQKWIISPKWETPMLNFNDTGIHPITSASSNLTVPLYGSASVTRGMWHQFGTIPTEPEKGIFLSIDDIPTDWLDYHWMLINTGSVYNNYSVPTQNTERFNQSKNFKSLTSLFGFDRAKSKVRLGELAESRTLREAVVAVPYILDQPEIADTNLSECSDIVAGQKKFIKIDPKLVMSAVRPSKMGTTSETGVAGYASKLPQAGQSIKNLVQKMRRYVLPPQFDFLNNRKINPMAMYIFEFEYKLDKDDLSYIWQNLAPRDYQKMSFQKSSVAHELFDTELLNENNLLDNPNLRWMVFKVKQKSQVEYWDLIPDQAGKASTQIWGARKKPKEGYDVSYNWPYDFISFVEAIKVDVDVMYKSPSNQTIPQNAQSSDKSAQKKKDAAAQSGLQGSPAGANKAGGGQGGGGNY